MKVQVSLKKLVICQHNVEVSAVATHIHLQCHRIGESIHFVASIDLLQQINEVVCQMRSDQITLLQIYITSNCVLHEMICQLKLCVTSHDKSKQNICHYVLYH